MPDAGSSGGTGRTHGKSEFWGYDEHERSVRDVVDEELWESEERWAIDEALGYARVTNSPRTVFSARHCCSKAFIDHFEAMLNDLLHEPLNVATATEKVQESEQEGLDAFA